MAVFELSVRHDRTIINARNDTQTFLIKLLLPALLIVTSPNTCKIASPYANSTTSAELIEPLIRALNVEIDDLPDYEKPRLAAGLSSVLCVIAGIAACLFLLQCLFLGIQCEFIVYPIISCRNYLEFYNRIFALRVIKPQDTSIACNYPFAVVSHLIPGDFLLITAAVEYNLSAFIIGDPLTI